MNVDAYLDRIGYSGTREPNAETLRQLHRAHMLTVPFENLDIALGRPIELALPLLYDKIVKRRRGGFCYELNGLFAWLLRELGFELDLLSARVLNAGTPGPEFDHLLLLVDVGEKWIADVGFGDSFVEPIGFGRINPDMLGRSYRLVEYTSDWVLQQRTPTTDWEAQHLFTLQPRTLADFRPMCHYHQTSAESGFTKNTICSLATTAGRVTLSNQRLITHLATQRQEQPIKTSEAYSTILQERFGIGQRDADLVSRIVFAADRDRE